MPMCDVGVVMMMMRDSGFFGGAESLLACLLLPNKQILCGFGMAFLAWARFWVGFAISGGVFGGKGSSLLYGCFLSSKVEYGSKMVCSTPPSLSLVHAS